MTSIVRLVFSAIGEVRSVMEKDAERDEKLNGGLQFIMEEMEIVEAHIKEKVPRGAVQEIMSRQLQDLAYDIEDFVEDLWEPGKYGRALVALGMDRRPQQLERIDRFQKRITSWKEWKKIIAESNEGEDTDVVDATSSALPPHEDSQPVELQGIEVPKREILELLSPSPAEGQQLRVVSIVGCHGVGKTALARAVYEDCRHRSASQEFDCVAWVVASGCDNKKALLHRILQSVRAALESRKEQENVKADSASTTNLHNKRLDNENVTTEPEGASTATVQNILLNKRVDNENDTTEAADASDLNGQDILLNSRTDIENVTIQAEGASTTTNLHDILLNKRCLIFIDDVQQLQMWKETVDACPLIGSKSRIIVTTSVRSVATACSSGSYVYSVQPLADGDSYSLFWRNVYGKQRDPCLSLATASESIFRKCGGLPLALTTVAKYLYLIKGDDMKSEHFEDAERNLGKDYLLGKNNTAMSVFKGMRRVLRECYDNLPDYDLRFFLLYLSIFPRRHQIKKMNLVRRLKSEGLVLNEDDCKCFDELCKCFDELIDRCIIEPVQNFKNSLVVKSCQVHDLVLEYIIQKSLDQNVVTLIQGPETLLIGKTASVRRLSVQSSSKESFHELEDRSAALRSLSIFDSEAFDLQSCMMLRLLDLESCKGIDKTFLKGLCKLRLLRYLSLRNTGIDELPRQIEELECLETLDIRGGTNNVTKLPMKPVFMLRKLAYLFGKFQLYDVPDSQEEIGKLSDFLQKRSVLHTLSGFVANKRHGLEHVILYAKKLKNVKVWCNDTSADSPTCISVPSHPSNRSQGTIMSFVKRCTGMERNRPCNRSEGSRNVENFDFIRILKKRSTTDLESISIVSSSGLCQDFLDSLEGPCRIRYIKLRGNLDRLPIPDRLSKLGRIKELQLCSTGRTIQELSVLHYLRGLEYLKLEGSERFCNGIFIVEEEGFESLKRLCINAPMLPEMQFKKGALESLTSLHLLCPRTKKQLSETVVGIRHLVSLTEVIHNSDMQEDWETVAKENPNRPCVKRQAE